MDALAAFAPERLGLRPCGGHRGAWIQAPGTGEIVVAPLAWQHARALLRRAFSRSLWTMTPPLAAADGMFALGDGISAGLALGWAAFAGLGERVFTVTAAGT